MRLRSSWSWAIYLLVAFTAAPLHGQQDGAYLFKTYCAICHEAVNGTEARGPEPDVLRQMTPEHILEVLEKVS